MNITKAKYMADTNQFSDWLRNQNTLLNSYDGFRAYNLDMIMWHFNIADKDSWILLETKCRGKVPADLSSHQRLTLETLHQSMVLNPSIDFRGTYIVSFANDGPESGSMIFKFDGQQWKSFGRIVQENELAMFFRTVLIGKKVV